MALSKKKLKLSSFLFVCIFSVSIASSSIAGFLDIGLGARPVGLGRAYTGIANDVNAIFYNPAGLTQLKNISLTSMYARLYPGLNSQNLHYEVLGAVVPLSILGEVGFAVTNFNIDTYKENMFFVSYGRRLPYNLSIGASLKMLRWSADGDVDPISGVRDQNFSKSTFSIDAGIIYRIPTSLYKRWIKKGHIQCGLMLQDVNRPNISESGYDSGKLPLGFAFGMAYLSDNLLISADYSKKYEFSKLHLGIEYEIYKLSFGSWNTALLFRGGGIRHMSDTKGGEIDLGFGLLVRKILIDYVYVNPMALENVDGSHKISLSFQY